MVKISPSVLACDFSRMREEISAMDRAGAEYIHLDVMDGHFVPNISFGAPVIKKIRPHSKRVFDTHLMISDPLRYIEDFAKAGSNIITFHIESKSDVAETISRIKSFGVKPAIAIKPATSIETVLPYLEDICMVLVMTVEPGFGGQSFMKDMCSKISSLRKESNRRGMRLDIQVDGGIDFTTAPIAVSHGANVLVAGSSLFSSPDYDISVTELRISCRS